MSECIRDEELERYHAGDLPDVQAEEVRAHLDVCAECASRLDALRGEEQRMLEKLRRLGMKHPTELGPTQPDALQSIDDEQTPPDASDAAISDYTSFAIEGYTIVEELHRGGQGVVYRAVQEHTKREVAVKVLLEGPQASKAARRRFEREIELAAQLKHPNIVTVFHSGLTPDGQQYCVMDYVYGTRLDEYVRERRLSLEKTLSLIAIVCDAVAYAHRRGIIHRDLKPSNIVVSDLGVPRVLDFGLAKHMLQPADTFASLSGHVFGTLPYMSPEQAGGHPEEIDIRSDVYSLGVILYQLLTGRFPYPVAVRLVDVIRHITYTPPTPPSRAWSSQTGVTKQPERASASNKCPIDADLQLIVLKALEKEPDRRYLDAVALAEDLRHYLAGEPITARRASHWYVLRKTVRKYKLRFMAAAVMLALALGAMVVISIMHYRQTQLLVQVEQERDRADRRFNQVRELAHSFIYGAHAKIANLQGATPARQYLVTTALEYLDSLAEEAGDDPQLLRELAGAYEFVGDVQGNPNQANLGDVEGALKSYGECLRIAKRLAEAEPDNPTYLLHLRVGYEKLGDMQRRLGRSAEALGSFREALRAAVRAHDIEPENIYLRSCLAVAHDKLGDVQRDLGQTDQALAGYLESRRIREAAAQADPENAKLQRGLFISYIKVANIDRDARRMEDALDGYLKAAEIAERFARIHPHEVRAQRDLAIIYSQIGYTQMQMGRANDAVESQENSVAVSRTLAQADPHDARAQHDLALAYNLLGEAQVAAGRLDDALAAYLDAQEILVALVAANDADIYHKIDLASARCHIGEILARLGRAEAGLASCREGYDSFASLARDYPENPGNARNLAEACYQLAAVYLLRATDAATPEEIRDETSRAEDARAEDLRAAESLLTQAVAIFERMRQAGILLESDAELCERVKDELTRCGTQLATLPEEPEAGPTHSP